MSKFNNGDKCKVVKNLLAPDCLGDVVEVVGNFQMNGRYYYHTLQDGVKGIASENCLEFNKEEKDNWGDEVRGKATEIFP